MINEVKNKRLCNKCRLKFHKNLIRLIRIELIVSNRMLAKYGKEFDRGMAKDIAHDIFSYYKHLSNEMIEFDINKLD